MAILDRVKERIQTDLSDNELQYMIDEANQAIIERFGPHANTDSPLTLTKEGRRRRLDLLRPLDTSHDVTVVEWITADARDVEFAVDVEDWWPDVSQYSVTLDDTDYRVWFGGRQLRLVADPLQQEVAGSIPAGSTKRGAAGTRFATRRAMTTGVCSISTRSGTSIPSTPG